MSLWMAVLVLIVMMGCVALIPVGLPGLWAIVVITLGLVLAGHVGWTVGLGVAAAALVAEVAELFVVARFGRAFGGSRRAFWGALVGGLAGLFIGVPIPLIGPVVMAFAGTFVGAGLVTLFETRSIGHSARVGWGVVLARTAAVALKIAIAVGVIASVGLALVI